MPTCISQGQRAFDYANAEPTLVPSSDFLTIREFVKTEHENEWSFNAPGSEARSLIESLVNITNSCARELGVKTKYAKMNLRVINSSGRTMLQLDIDVSGEICMSYAHFQEWIVGKRNQRDDIEFSITERNKHWPQNWFEQLYENDVSFVVNFGELAENYEKYCKNHNVEPNLGRIKLANINFKRVKTKHYSAQWESEELLEFKIYRSNANDNLQHICWQMFPFKPCKASE